jgi:hypothetical protein
MNGVGKSRRLVFIGTKVSTAQRTPPRFGENGWIAAIAVGALAFGALVYMLDRPAATVYLLPNALSFAPGHPPWVGPLGGFLPEIAHVYAFILLTVAVSPWPARVSPICAFWWLIDSLFELGQHPALAPHIAAALPGWFQHVPILDHTANYFLYGTFDPGDLVAITLGAVSAHLTIGVIRRGEVGHVVDV